MLGQKHREDPSGWMTWLLLTSSPHRCLDPTPNPKHRDHLTPQVFTVTERLSLVLKERAEHRECPGATGVQ